VGQGRSSRVFRYDTPGQHFGRRDAEIAFLAAVRTRYPASFEELSRLPVHQLEGGVHIVEASEIPRFSRFFAERRLGRLYVVSGRIPNVIEDLKPLDVKTTFSDSFPRGPAVVIDDHLGQFAEPALVVFIPASINMWAAKWKLSTPRLEATAVLIRATWSKSPDAAKDFSMITPGLPIGFATEFASVPSEGHWNSLGVPAIGANPMLESETQFLKRASQHYNQRVERYYEARLSPQAEQGVTSADTKEGGLADRIFVATQTLRELHSHAGWLARVQVGGESPAHVGREFKATRAAVDHAVRRLARFLNLPLRPFRRPGRPPGRRELNPRRRVASKQK
jgi:hypothetical protein